MLVYLLKVPVAETHR